MLQEDITYNMPGRVRYRSLRGAWKRLPITRRIVVMKTNDTLVSRIGNRRRCGMDSHSLRRFCPRKGSPNGVRDFYWNEWWAAH